MKFISNNKKILIICVAILCAVVAVGTILTILYNEGKSSDLKTVSLQEVETDDISQNSELSGNLVPSETVKLSFKVSGILSDVSVEEGQIVEKGQSLAALQQNDYILSQNAAKAQWQSAQMQINSEIPAKLEQAKAQMDLTQLTYNRIKRLVEEEAVAQASLDEIAAKLTVDKNTYKQASEAYSISVIQLEQAKAAYDLSVSNLEATSIYSPLDGIVLSKIFQTGESISAGYPVVVVGNIDQMQVEVGLPDSMINDVYIGDIVEVYVYGIEKNYEAVVAEVGALADATTRTFTVKVNLDNADHKLKAGMIAKVRLERVDEELILIPFSSVVHLAEGEFVFIYNPKTSAVEKRSIKTGEIHGDKIEIISGVKMGEKLVIEGQYKVTDGEKVKVND